MFVSLGTQHHFATLVANIISSEARTSFRLRTQNDVMPRINDVTPYGVNDVGYAQRCCTLCKGMLYYTQGGGYMKILKRTLLILLIIIFALPIISYIGIVITNNTIADKIEKDLVAHQLPSNTELIDSLSIAGKLNGNGNGMQYMGAILVDSDLSEDELKEYYSSEFDYIEVRKQETANIDFIHPRNYSFNGFSETNKETYYSITCWDDDRREKFGEFISELLDFDIRGH